MQLDALGKLAAKCPRCFGPPVGVTDENEPDIIVAQDGNFQHKRHAAASVPISGYDPPVPELFVPPAEVQDMADELTRLSLSNSRLERQEEVVSRYFSRGDLCSQLDTYVPFLCSILAQNHTRLLTTYGGKTTSKGLNKLVCL